MTKKLQKQWTLYATVGLVDGDQPRPYRLHPMRSALVMHEKMGERVVKVRVTVIRDRARGR